LGEWNELMFELIGIAGAEPGPSKVRTSAAKLRVGLGNKLAFPTPLVAYDLPWSTISIERAKRIYDFLDGMGISVAGLRSEFTEVSDESESQTVSDRIQPLDLEVPPPPLCPYRPERYGLDLIDLREARLVDVRLLAARNALGLSRYTPDMMRRWDRRASKMADDDAMAFGGMNAMHWPPDISSKDKLCKKIHQLRILSAPAILGVSVEAAHVSQNLDWLVDSGADFLTIVASDWPETEAMALARLIAGVSDRLQEHGRDGLGPVRLMVVPPSEVTVLDVIKLLSLGADLVAVDGWCREFLEVRKVGLGAADWAETALGVRSSALVNEENAIDFTPLESRLALLRETLDGMGIADVGELGRQQLINYSHDPAMRMRGVREVLA
jgi:hypothetical protein